MKSLFFTLLALPFALFSQNYVPFPTSNAVWNISTYDGTGGGVQNNYYQYALSNDTVIEGKTWKRLLEKGGARCYNTCHYYNSTSLKGFIREENKKIFFKTGTDSLNKTVVLYDFDDLRLGDTLTKRNLWGQYIPNANQVIAAIDSVNVGNVWRKRYRVSNAGVGQMYLIEGIGSTRGLIPSYYEFESGVRTECMRVGETTIWGSGLCDVRNANADISENAIMISPNPVRDMLIIKGLEAISTKEVLFLNAFGQVLKRVKLADNEQQIAVVDFPNGLYFCQIQDNKQRVLTLKFVIAR